MTAIIRPFSKETIPGVQLNAQKQPARELVKLGESKAVDRFIRSYGKVRVQALYAARLRIYFKWPRAAGVSSLSPDELIVDSLRCRLRQAARQKSEPVVRDSRPRESLQ
jgi:hypothetical protein